MNLLLQSTLLFGTALIVAWLFRIFKAPTIVGFLIAGILMGPSVLNWVPVEEVEGYAEIGIVLLLYIVGLELSPEPLIRMGRSLLIVSAAQIGATAIVGAAVLYVGIQLSPLYVVLFLGIAGSFSSTAITLKTLSDRRELRTPLGSLLTGVLLIQDVVAIGLMLFLPFLALGANQAGSSNLRDTAVGFFVFAVGTLIARRILPWILQQVGERGGSELRTLFAVFMAAAGALAAHKAGWPPAIGACIAGLLLAEADLKHQLVADILPFRDVFNAIFFLSLGMLLDLKIVMAHPWAIAGAVVAALLVKAGLAGGAIRLGGWPERIAFRGGIALCTISEFGYILTHEMVSLGLVPKDLLSYTVALAVGSMLIGAALFPLSGAMANVLSPLWRSRPVYRGREQDTETAALSGHVIVVGFGLNGQHLAKVLRATHIPFCVIEMNPVLAARAREMRVPCIRGDATRQPIMEEAGIHQARALVVGINDPIATRRIVAQARSLHPTLYILARTEYATEMDALYASGATTVIPADFETSIEVFAHVLKELRIPDNVIEAQIASVRAGNYSVLRGREAADSERLRELMEVFKLTATQTFYLREDASVAGRTLAELDLRNRTGVTLIAVVRDGKPTTNPGGDFRLCGGDVLVLLGSHAQLDAAQELLSRTAESKG